RLDAEMRAALHRAVAFRLAADLADMVDQLAFELLLPLRRPLAEPDQMARQALDRVAIGPVLPLVLGTVAGRVVARRMRRGAVGEQLDQRRAVIGAGPLRRPLRRRMDREEIVAVDPEASEAEADRAGREGRRLAAS